MPLFFDMSKYEPRAEGIKEIAKEYGWKISWKRQGRYIYATIAMLPPKNQNFYGIIPLLTKWYPDISITSARARSRTYRVFDIWKAIGGKQQ